MNRYDYMDKFDKVDTPFNAAKKMAYQSIYNDIASIEKDDQFIVGWNTRADAIVKKFIEYRYAYTDDKDPSKISQAAAVLRQSLNSPPGIAIVIGKMIKMLEDPPS